MQSCRLIGMFSRRKRSNERKLTGRDKEKVPPQDADILME
jgi:hypothetical protein